MPRSEVPMRMLKLIVLSIVMVKFLWFVPYGFSEMAQERPDDPRMTYRALYEDPRFQEPLPFAKLDYPRLHAAMLYATNAVRVRHGLAPLARHDKLETAARRYAERMVKHNFMAHMDPYAADHLRTPQQRLRAAGVENAMPAENLASFFGIQYQEGEKVYRLPGGKGQFSRTPKGPPLPQHTYRSFAEGVVELWMSSPGHRANVLAEAALELGCGAAFFWDASGFPKFKAVQLFQLYEHAKP